ARWGNCWRAWDRWASRSWGGALTPDDSHDFLNHFSLYQRQALVAAEVGIGEVVLVKAEEVKDGRVDVAEVVRLLDGFESDSVGRADPAAAANTAAGQPHGEAQVVMIATFAALCLG